MKKNILWGLVWRALFFVSNFVFNIAFARYFGAQQSGAIYFIINNLSLFILISTVNIETGIGYHAAVTKQIYDGYLLVLGLAFTIFSITALLLCLKFSFIAQLFTDQNWPWYFSVIYIFGNILVSIISALLYAQNKYLLPNCLLAASTFIASAIYFLSKKWSFLSPEQCLSIFFWYNLLQGVLLFIFFIIGLNHRFVWKKIPVYKIKQILTFSLIALVNNVFFFLLYRMDYWFVDRFTSLSEMGNYVQVSKFGQLLLIAPVIFSSIIQPRITDKSIERFDKTAAMAFTVIIIGGCFSFFFVLFFGHLFFENVLGKEFNGMYIPTLVKIPAIVFLSLQFVLGTWFSGTNKVKYNLYATLVGVVIMAIGDYFLIPVYGIVGASIATLIAYSLVFATAVYLFHFKTNQNFIGLYKSMVQIMFNLRKETVMVFKGFR